MSINLHKSESIAFIKFMGRLHDLLTGIMENINYCYSMQVYSLTEINKLSELIRYKLLSIPTNE